ncbi:MAG: hypothetical protein C0518_11450 [Opitutus sp.]|nr:hypothetical protein [Opitutus sp.]
MKIPSQANHGRLLPQGETHKPRRESTVFGENDRRAQHCAGRIKTAGSGSKPASSRAQTRLRAAKESWENEGGAVRRVPAFSSPVLR